MKKIWIIIGVIVAVALATMLIIISTKREPEEIKIGAILPLTGPAAQFGQYTKEGIEIGLEELSQQGLTYRIKVLYEDSQGDPKTAVSILNKFIKIDKVDTVFVLTSVETLAILPIITKEKIITFTGTLLPAITEKSHYLFRNATSLDQETKFMADFLATQRNKPSVAIIYVNNDAGVVADNQFRKTYHELSGEIVEAQAYEPGATDFRSQLVKIKDSNPEYLYILSYKEFGLIMKQARELGIKAKFIGTTTFEDPSGVKIAGEAANGAIYTVSSFNPEASEPKLAQFQEKYRKRYGRNAELYAALFRDNIHILALAFKTKPKNAEELRSAILNVRIFDGVSGTTKFLPNRDVEKSLALKIIRDGKFEYLER